MRRSVGLIALALSSLAGCSAQKTTAESEGKKLSVTAPLNTSIIQGDTRKITVRVVRQHFDEDVAIRLEQLPAGVVVKEENPKVPRGASEITCTLVADLRAPVAAPQEVKVIASGGGLEATSRFLVGVREKK